MANHPLPIALTAALGALILGTALTLAVRADSFTLRPSEWSALRFTVTQAALSAALSALSAIPLARALYRRRFPGRSLAITLLGAPFLLPVVVAVLGILSVYGKTGLLPLPIFGLQGVLLTNVFFNLPLCTRILLGGWQAIPTERFRLAETLNLPPSARFRHLEAPMLRATLPGALVTTFLLCLTSFVVALTFGGGPKATTLELAIYQALRFDFDLGRAALLATLQFALCAAALLLAAAFLTPTTFGAGRDRPLETTPAKGRLTDALTITLALAFLMTPLAMILIEGVKGLTTLPSAIWPAAARSTAIALTSATLATIAALALALATAANPRIWPYEAAAMLPMAASGLVLGTGIFLWLQPFTSPQTLALPVTIVVNAATAIPLVYRLILPDARTLNSDYARLAQTLNLQGLPKLRFLTLPRLARPLGLGMGLAAALSMGDLGVVALFASTDAATLPLLISRLSGAYRLREAASASLLLIAISFTLFALFERGGRRAAI